MKIKGLQDEDFINYRKPSMFISMGSCDWKCCVEGDFDSSICQNSPLAQAEETDISYERLYERYTNNPITQAIVIGGLEPLTQFEDVLNLINLFRSNGCMDDFVIYTGYYPYEIGEALYQLAYYDNVIIKFGRFKINNGGIDDKVLGVHLASDNQYAYKLNKNSQDIIRAMIDNDGYCPCMPVKKDETKCSCLAFRMIKSPNECHCGMFRK